MGPNVPHLCLQRSLSHTSFHQFTVHFAAAGSKGFQSNTWKILISRKSRAYRSQIYNLWEHHANLNDNDLKTFFEFNFPYSKGIIFSPKLCKKTIQVIVDQHPIQGGVVMLLVASCKGNCDKLQLDGLFSLRTDFTYKYFFNELFTTALFQVDVALSLGTPFTNFHHHLIYMLEKVTTKAGKNKDGDVNC